MTKTLDTFFFSVASDDHYSLSAFLVGVFGGSVFPCFRGPGDLHGLSLHSPFTHSDGTRVWSVHTRVWFETGEERRPEPARSVWRRTGHPRARTSRPSMGLPLSLMTLDLPLAMFNTALMHVEGECGV